MIHCINLSTSYLYDNQNYKHTCMIKQKLYRCFGSTYHLIKILLVFLNKVNKPLLQVYINIIVLSKTPIKFHHKILCFKTLAILMG